MSEMFRVLIADDHPLYRDGVGRTLAESGRFSVVGEAASAEEAVALAVETQPALALVDLSMPGGGIEAVRGIAEKAPDVRIAVLTVSEQDDDVVQSMSAGACGYCLKGIGGAELVGVAVSLAEGGAYVSPSLAARVVGSLQSRSDRIEVASPLDELSTRESAILRLVAKGLSNKEIGAAVTLQEKTVKHYMTAIFQKLGARNRVEAAMMARDHWG